MARPSVMDAAVETEAIAILARHGMSYDLVSGYFKKEKVNPTFSWDRFVMHRFFTNPERLNGCCGVIEMQTCFPPIESQFPGVTQADWSVLFKYHVSSLLRYRNRRMALITLTNVGNQKEMVPLVKAAGFKKVSVGFNPGTRRKINVWALSI